MASIWTVKPDVKKIDLVYTDGDGNPNPFWVKIKKKLTVGEQRKMTTAGFRGVRGTGNADRGAGEGTEISIDWQSQSFARAEVYLVEWSLEDDKQKKLPLTRETIEALHEDVFKLIEGAITEHVKELEEEKKSRSGATAPSET